MAKAQNMSVPKGKGEEPGWHPLPPYGASLARPILRLGPQDRVLEEYVKAEISREMMRLAARGRVRSRARRVADEAEGVGQTTLRNRPPIALAPLAITRRVPEYNSRRPALRPPGSVAHRRTNSGVSLLPGRTSRMHHDASLCAPPRCCDRPPVLKGSERGFHVESGPVYARSRMWVSENTHLQTSTGAHVGDGDRP